MSYNSGLTTASINGTVTSTQTTYTATNVHTDNAAATWTVPANKRWRVLAVGLMTSGAAGQNLASIGGTAVINIYGIAGQIQVHTRNWNYDAAPVLTAGQSITSTKAGNFIATWATYVEESV